MPPDKRTGLQKRLDWALSVAGCSAREVDRLAGLTPGHSLLVASGRKLNANSHTLAALGVVLGISLDWLVLSRGEPPTAAQIQAAVQRAMAEREAVRAEISRALGRESSRRQVVPAPSVPPPAPAVPLRAKPVRRPRTKSAARAPTPAKPRAKPRATPRRARPDEASA